MKKRTGLVSNSSSSSYIVKLKKSFVPLKCPTCERETPNLLLLLAEGYDPDTQIKATNWDLISSLEDEVASLKQAIDAKTARLYEVDEYTSKQT